MSPFCFPISRLLFCGLEEDVTKTKQAECLPNANQAVRCWHWRDGVDNSSIWADSPLWHLVASTNNLALLLLSTHAAIYFVIYTCYTQCCIHALVVHRPCSGEQPDNVTVKNQRGLQSFVTVTAKERVAALDWQSHSGHDSLQGCAGECWSRQLHILLPWQIPLV